MTEQAAPPLSPGSSAPATAAPAASSAVKPSLGYQPLYRQVKEELIRRIAEGVWGPGAALPSEPQLAVELGVSAGTVRKALDEMAVEHLVVRRQGKGTFVGRHDEARILFQYFRLVPDQGERQFPDSVMLDQAAGRATLDEAAVLGVAIGAPILRMRRKRSLGGEPVIVEDITVPLDLFPGIETMDIPNNLYGLYADGFGVTIGQAVERLKATAADAEVAAALNVPVGTPLLGIDRLAKSLDGRVAEWRVSLCLTQRHHYLSEMR
jgi:GntR family transcriptional regulator